MQEIIKKLKEADLKGRGGAMFPAYLKWQAVLDAKAEKKYIICNAAEGELDLNKDKYLLENFLEEIIGGIKIALEAIDNSSAVFYLNPQYYELFSKEIERHGIEPVKEEAGYIGGEESVAIETIEGHYPMPRKRPPFVSEKGLFDFPTLVNNVETFYCVEKINKGEYQNERFYQIIGKNNGVFKLKEGMTISEILKATENYPDFPFYVQAGGGAIGEIFLEEELNIPIKGEGFVRIISFKEDPFSLMERWAEFLNSGNCDKCTPCREGLNRILEMIKTRKLDYKKLDDIFFAMEKTSFCALGKGAPLPFRSMINKVIKP